MHDLIIIGGGPAGISAAIYAARYKLNFLLMTESLGGWLNEIEKIENYPGFTSISGFDLIEKYKEQLTYLQVPVIYKNVISVNKDVEGFNLTDNANETYRAKTIIIASGSKKQNLNIPGEKEFLGAGVSYCAICDAMFFKNKRAAVIGGANSAVSAALHLARIADTVYLIYRKDKLRAAQSMVDNLKKMENVKIIFNTNLVKIGGVNKVEYVELDNNYKGGASLALDGVFIEIGLIPITELVKNIGIELDETRQIKIDDKGKTNIAGAFAAGDVTNGQGGLKQFVTALAGGAIAATEVNRYLRN